MIELPDGQWCAFEIKLGANQIDAAAENLLEIKKQIETDPKGKPPPCCASCAGWRMRPISDRTGCSWCL